MIELSPDSAPEYLACRSDIPAGPWLVTSLGGGVSNTVLLVEGDGCRFVMKQSLAKLRVKEDWFADQRRIHREAAAMRKLAAELPEGAVPRILFEDPDNCIYGMEAAPAGSSDWKTQLLRGEVRVATAEAAARILAAQIQASFRDEAAQREFGDQTCFDQLRLDPYYRFTAGRHPDLAGYFADRIEACRREACALVHGDFSPKNFLVSGDRVTLIDFEVIHYGDPAFDAAFLLNHLLLKSIHRPADATQYAAAAVIFWRRLAGAVPRQMDRLEAGTIAHLGCLLLARIDGKSPAEYLTGKPDRQELARQTARSLLLDPPGSVPAVIERLQTCL